MSAWRPVLAAALLAPLLVLAALVGLRLADVTAVGGVYDDGDHDELSPGSAWDDALAPPSVALVPPRRGVALSRHRGVSPVRPFVLRFVFPRAPPA